MKEDIVRTLKFNPELYEKLMREAEEEARSFPRHVMWILKKYTEGKT